MWAPETALEREEAQCSCVDETGRSELVSAAGVVTGLMALSTRMERCCVACRQYYIHVDGRYTHLPPPHSWYPSLALELRAPRHPCPAESEAPARRVRISGLPATLVSISFCLLVFFSPTSEGGRLAGHEQTAGMPSSLALLCRCRHRDGGGPTHGDQAVSNEPHQLGTIAIQPLDRCGVVHPPRSLRAGT